MRVTTLGPLLALVAVPLLFVAGCEDDTKVKEKAKEYNSTTVPAQPAHVPKLLYFSTQGTGDIGVYGIDAATGELTLLNPSAAFAGGAVFGMDTDPDGKFLYAAVWGTGFLKVWDIDADTGALNFITQYSVSSNPQDLIVEPLGRFVYVAKTGSNAVSAFMLDSALGTLTAAGSFASNTPFGMQANPAGTTLFVTRSLPDELQAMSINQSTGALTDIVPSLISTGINPNGVAVHPSGNFVYTASTAGAGNDVMAFNFDEGSGVTSLINPYVAAGADGIAMHPSGKYLYTANNSGNSVSAFTINAATGALTEIPGESPYAAGLNCTQAAMDRAGRFLYVTCFTSNEMWKFAINPNDGTLTQIGAAQVTAGGTTAALVVSYPP